MFDKEEKKLLAWLVEKEIEDFKDDEKEIRPIVPQTITIEENYEEFLKKVLGKLR